MVQAKVSTHAGNIRQLTVRGHAKAGEHGSDLVCAGVSCIMYGALNALDELFKGDCQLSADKNNMTVITGSANEKLQAVLHAVLIQLETMEELYPRNLKITRKEV